MILSLILVVELNRCLFYLFLSGNDLFLFKDDEGLEEVRRSEGPLGYELSMGEHLVICYYCLLLNGF